MARLEVEAAPLHGGGGPHPGQGRPKSRAEVSGKRRNSAPSLLRAPARVPRLLACPTISDLPAPAAGASSLQ